MHATTTTFPGEQAATRTSELPVLVAGALAGLGTAVRAREVFWRVVPPAVGVPTNFHSVSPRHRATAGRSARLRV